MPTLILNWLKASSDNRMSVSFYDGKFSVSLHRQSINSSASAKSLPKAFTDALCSLNEIKDKE